MKLTVHCIFACVCSACPNTEKDNAIEVGTNGCASTNIAHSKNKNRCVEFTGAAYAKCRLRIKRAEKYELNFLESLKTW